MCDCEKINDENIDLKFELRQTKDKLNVYSDILLTIDTSVSELFKQETENERFGFSEDIDYRECLVNLKKSLQEYKRVYRVNF
jgi:hypothetical protein